MKRTAVLICMIVFMLALSINQAEADCTECFKCKNLLAVFERNGGLMKDLLVPGGTHYCDKTACAGCFRTFL